MKKSILRVSLIALIAIIAYTITNTLIAAGTFKSIEPHFNGTTTKVPLPVAGPEDIAIDTTTGIAFIAVDDRRANHRNPGSVEGAILIMNLNDSARTIRNITPAGFTDLHPHGISLWKKDSATTLLFVVNHRQLNRSDVVERFEWRNDSLIHLESF